MRLPRFDFAQDCCFGSTARRGGERFVVAPKNGRPFNPDRFIGWRMLRLSAALRERGLDAVEVKPPDACAIPVRFASRSQDLETKVERFVAEVETKLDAALKVEQLGGIGA